LVENTPSHHSLTVAALEAIAKIEAPFRVAGVSKRSRAFFNKLLLRGGRIPKIGQPDTKTEQPLKDKASKL